MSLDGGTKNGDPRILSSVAVVFLLSQCKQDHWQLTGPGN